jgi:hypothetical protein
MGDNELPVELANYMQIQWKGYSLPPAGLIEQRVMELESLGLLDEEEMPGVPSYMRQFAIASLQHSKPPFFITLDNELLELRDELEIRYGMKILSIPEAILLLRDANGPPN